MGRVPAKKTQRTSKKRTARATVATSAAPRTASAASVQPTNNVPLGIVSPWGRVDEEFALIKADLKRLFWITALLLVLLAILTVLLR